MPTLALPRPTAPLAPVTGLARTTRSLPGRLAAVLRWPAPPGAYRRLLDPLARGAGVRATIEAVIPETSRAATLVLRPGPGWRPHRPGQWVSLGVDVDGVRHHRCYSITSIPSDVTTIDGGRGQITITVQAIPDGTVSNHLVRSARPGDIVQLDGPDGDFTLPESPTEPTHPILFVTGGSGITPVMAMLRAIDTGLVARRDVVVLHHAPTTVEALFTDEIGRITRRHPGIRMHLTETGTGAPPPELAITAARLDALCSDWRRRETWVCGPRPLLDAVTALWDDPATGASAPLHVERFSPAVAEVTERVAGTLTFTTSGTSVASDGTTTVLDLAESAGLTPLSGCRMGVCRRCVVPLSSGTVRDLRDGRTECEPGTHVQICVTAPVGDVDIEI